MMKRLYYSLIITIGYLIVSNLGNMVFGISKEFSWTTTLWEYLSVGTCFRIYGTFYSAIHFIFLLLLNTSNTFDL